MWNITNLIVFAVGTQLLGPVPQSIVSGGCALRLKLEATTVPTKKRERCSPGAHEDRWMRRRTDDGRNGANAGAQGENDVASEEDEGSYDMHRVEWDGRRTRRVLGGDEGHRGHWYWDLRPYTPEHVKKLADGTLRWGNLEPQELRYSEPLAIAALRAGWRQDGIRVPLNQFGLAGNPVVAREAFARNLIEWSDLHIPLQLHPGVAFEALRHDKVDWSDLDTQLRQRPLFALRALVARRVAWRQLEAPVRTKLLAHLTQLNGAVKTKFQSAVIRLILPFC
jgi:hypothetical protein